MKVVFTICSANYLAHAKTLGGSLLEHNPDYHFVIGLVDRLPKEPVPSFWLPFELILVEDLGISAFKEMAARYNVVELNTAVKPFYMEHLYRRNPAVQAVIYLDPDILVCASFKSLEDKLRACNIVVTPHSCTFDDSSANMFYEIAMLGTGIYNLGFVATSRGSTTFAFLEWWKKRLRDYCYYGDRFGMFVDQIWVNLGPLYFPGFHVEKNPGYNMCYWNHFERSLSRENGRYVVNGNHDLLFYHFSGYDPANPAVIARRAGVPLCSFWERPDLKPLYQEYRDRLLKSGYALASPLTCSFGRKPAKPPAIKVIRRALRDIMGTLPAGIRRPMKHLALLLRRFGSESPKTDRPVGKI